VRRTAPNARNRKGSARGLRGEGSAKLQTTAGHAMAADSETNMASLGAGSRRCYERLWQELMLEQREEMQCLFLGRAWLR
jgi:hypothetical protein